MWEAHIGVTMSSSNAAARRLLALCWLIPLPELTQEEVDYLFRRLVEDAPSSEEADDPTDGLSSGPGRDACG
jgi:hypothetical protein